MRKILIVDDQPEVRELLKVTLELDDCQICFAESGQEALEVAYIERPNVILLDIMMPDSELDGLEVCRRLKSDPGTAEMAVILLSAKGQSDDIKAGLAAGANDYITKPFSPIALIKKIEQEFQNGKNGGGSGVFNTTILQLVD